MKILYYMTVGIILQLWSANQSLISELNPHTCDHALDGFVEAFFTSDVGGHHISMTICVTLPSYWAAGVEVAVSLLNKHARYYVLVWHLQVDQVFHNLFNYSILPGGYHLFVPGGILHHWLWYVLNLLVDVFVLHDGTIFIDLFKLHFTL